MRTKKIVTKVLVALALTFMIPQLVLLYMWEDLSTRSTLLLFASTTLLVGIGAFLIWDIVQSIRSLFRNIDEITRNDLKAEVTTSSDEIQIMGDSVEIISKKIVENMEELQRSTALVENTKKELNDALLYVESVMNSMGDALIVIDAEYKINRINKAAKDLLKFGENDLLGRTVDALFEYVDEDTFFRKNGVIGKRMTCISMENEKIPVDVNIQPLIDLIGGRIGHVLVARDIRETLDLNGRLEEANALLEVKVQKRSSKLAQGAQALSAKDTQYFHQNKMAAITVLTSGIAHEISKPLESMSQNAKILQENFGDILSYTQLLEYGLQTLAKENDPERRNYELEQIKQVQARMKIKTVLADSEKMLKASRMELKHIKEVTHDLEATTLSNESKMQGSDLNKELQDTLDLAAHELKIEAEIITHFEFIPPVTCYPKQLKQVFMDLLHNASQAAKIGDIIRIQTCYKDGQIYIIFQDTGAGIRTENLKHIFDPFFTTQKSGKGRGLGLYFSFGIIEKHGGTLSVESTPGEGTTFTIQIPVAPKEMFVHPALTIPAPVV